MRVAIGIGRFDITLWPYRKRDSEGRATKG